ncbi:MAG: response regulator [Lentisphaeraceae bacterium]|nr:response regulator [Lentisphaeraceae bacterium]
MNILIVEDKTGQALLIQKIIQKNSSHQVYTAKDAFDGYALLKAMNRVDVVILDNELPYVNGIEFLQKLKAHECMSSIPIVMSTADEEYESFKSVGADYCLKKPFGKQDLMSVLDEINGD